MKKLNMTKFTKLIEKHDNKSEAVVIKSKKEILEFTIKTGIIFKKNLNIYADSEKLCIGKTLIKMENLKKIYLFKTRIKIKTLFQHAYGYSCSLEIREKNIINNKSINLDWLSESDLDKIDKLFDHFIYSNQIDFDKLNSDEYKFLLEENLNIYEYNFNKYYESQKNTDTLTIYDKEYLLTKVLPKSHYKKYLNKNYILFESQFKNSNYMDVWIDCEHHVTILLWTLILLLMPFAIIIFTLISCLIYRLFFF